MHKIDAKSPEFGGDRARYFVALNRAYAAGLISSLPDVLGYNLVEKVSFMLAPKSSEGKMKSRTDIPRSR
jgi:hypothetical protein